MTDKPAAPAPEPCAYCGGKGRTFFLDDQGKTCSVCFGTGHAHPAAPAPEPTRSQKMREAGFTRRPTWKSLPSDNMDDEPAPECQYAHDKLQAARSGSYGMGYIDGRNSRPLPAAPSAPVEEVMDLAMALRKACGITPINDAYDALRAAIEQIVRERDEDRERVIAAEQGWNDDVIELTERAERAEQEAAALRELLKEVRNGNYEVELLARINAALKEGK